MAHHDISRQLELFGLAHDDIAQRADAGIHAIGAHALPNDGFDQYPGRFNAPPHLVRQFERCAFGHLGRLAPGQGSLEKNALWHRAAGMLRLTYSGALTAPGRARQCSRWLRSRSTTTPTSRELRMAPGLLKEIRTQATPKSSRRSMATCSARVSTRWKLDSSTNASTRFAIRL